MDLSDFGLAPIEFTGIDDQELKDQITEALMEVNDPELNVDIVNLGLVYSVHMDDEKNLAVKMSLTAMGCPLAGSISGQAAAVLNNLPGINHADVEIVWNPPWDKNRVSRVAAIQLGVR